jgi:hypothetical protein
VFDAAEVTAVTARLGDGEEVALEQDPGRPMLWSGVFDSSGVGEGEVQLTVTAGGSEQRSRSITVLVEAGAPCPEEVEPDGGMDDGGDDGGDDDGGDGGLDADDVDDYDYDHDSGDDGGGDDASIRADDATIQADEPFDEGGVASGGGCMCDSAGGTGVLWGLIGLLVILRQRGRRLPVEPRARQTG